MPVPVVVSALSTLEIGDSAVNQWLRYAPLDETTVLESEWTETVVPVQWMTSM